MPARIARATSLATGGRCQGRLHDVVVRAESQRRVGTHSRCSACERGAARADFDPAPRRVNGLALSGVILLVRVIAMAYRCLPWPGTRRPLRAVMVRPDWLPPPWSWMCFLREDKAKPGSAASAHTQSRTAISGRSCRGSRHAHRTRWRNFGGGSNPERGPWSTWPQNDGADYAWPSPSWRIRLRIRCSPGGLIRPSSSNSCSIRNWRSRRCQSASRGTEGVGALVGAGADATGGATGLATLTSQSSRRCRACSISPWSPDAGGVRSRGGAG